MWEVLRNSAGDLSGLVVLDNVRHDVMSERVSILREGYGENTWPSKAGAVQDALNLFFDPVPDTGIPVVFVDRVAGRLLAKKACEQSGATTQRLGGGRGYALSIPTRERAVWLDDRLHVARALCDINAEHTGREDANPFLRNGWTPALQAQVDAAARVARAKANGKGEDVKRDTGRYFVMHLPPYALPAIEDPHLHDRIDRAIARHTDSPGFRRGWQAKHDLWCRGDESFSMTMRSFHLGALEMGERRFGRLVIIKDKPTKGALLKPAAFSPEFGKVMLGRYFNVERRAQDPKGWGLQDYERECFAGNEEALDTPVFYTLAGMACRQRRRARCSPGSSARPGSSAASATPGCTWGVTTGSSGRSTTSRRWTSRRPSRSGCGRRWASMSGGATSRAG